MFKAAAVDPQAQKYDCCDSSALLTNNVIPACF